MHNDVVNSFGSPTRHKCFLHLTGFILETNGEFYTAKIVPKINAQTRWVLWISKCQDLACTKSARSSDQGDL